MGIKLDLRVILAQEDLSEAELARKLNVTPQVLNRKINRETMPYNEAKHIAEILNYEIVWNKKSLD